ncbi:hypothetical protein CLV47_11558 [Antricoccus suffuscus]|uniref:Secreted protein n=1 Tax=Antricoccus suffuscus TaxID=1629062 RepID=A0A2T0ZWB2_9ACTN|nr:DUF6167 family protein [Antricoccus suffuscus]PRZ40630.1 hypothetical protein CLV47_11558 [Antricoccus suffuscus]
MRRIFWLAMGITIGVLVVRKASKAAEQLTPNHLANRTGNVIADFGTSMKKFADDVRVSMKQREVEIREGVGFDGTLGAKAEDNKD